MPVEIEAKMKVDALSPVRQKLRELNAAPVTQTLETNIYFDTEDRSLLAADEGLRLRLARDLHTLQQQCTMTYKGPRQHGQLKSREETELVVGSCDDACSMLERLGFVRILSFQKKRESWKFQNCKVELDEMPYLGCYVEVEGPSEESVLAVRQALNLSDHPLIKTSYIAMLVTYLQEHGITQQVIVFNTSFPVR